jgi:hypothetical protein
MAAEGILAIWNDCVPRRRAEFEAWYQTEHLIERLAVPGFLFGRRHEALSGAPRYFAFYVTESTGVLTSAPYLQRLDNPTPLTRTVMSEIFRNTSRTVCRRVARAGHFRGSTAVTLRFDALPDRSTLVPLIETLARDPAVASAELWEAVDADVPMATEERLRGRDRKIRGCLMVETLRGREARAIAARLAEQFADADTGAYRVLCQIGRGDV